MNKLNFLFLALVWVSLVTSCTESSSGFDAEEVCPSTGTNQYGMSNRGTFVDERDGQVYKYITIGDKIWMDQNLNYASEKSICYNELQVNCNVYGRLYLLQHENSFSEEYGKLNQDMLDTICPKGWRVPTLNEWNAIVELMDGLDNFKNSECMDVSLYSGFASFGNNLRTGEMEDYVFHYVGRIREWATTSTNSRGTMNAFAVDYTGNIKNNTDTFVGFISLRCIKKEDWEL